MLRISAFLFFLSGCCFAQNQPLTIEAIASGNLAGRAPESIEFSPDGAKVSFIQRGEGGERGELWYVDTVSGVKSVLVSEGKLSSLAPANSSIGDERQREWRTRYGVAAYHWAPDSKSLLFDSRGQLWLYRLDTGVGVQVTSAPEPSSDPKFSPDGKRLAYVNRHNLWVRDLPDGAERAITKRKEEDETLNGEVDWVYAEELKVRSNYFWSPDSRQIAYLQMDERNVPTSPIVDYSQLHAHVDQQKYPQPGDSNPEARLGVLDVGSGKTRWVTLHNSHDAYIPRFGWLAPGWVWAEVLNRAQNHLTLFFVNASTGDAKAVLTEDSEAWVNVNDNFTVLKSGGKFLWTSWRDGHTHIYAYSFDQQNPTAAQASLVGQVTKGEYEVFNIAGVDESAGRVFFTADPNDPRQRQLFSIKLDGTEMQQVSRDSGTHAITWGPNSATYVDRYSSTAKPPAFSLCKVGGPCTAFHQPREIAFERVTPQWLDLVAADGKTKLYGQLYLPSGPEAGKIPVILHPYGGPSGQSVRDDWGREGGLFQEYLAQKGFAVLVVDNRGMANRGRDFNAFLKHHFGEIELSDQLAALDQVVKKYPQLDGTRVGIYGGSYGGYMVLYGMTHTDRFKAGVSISPVSSYRLYDSIYTERYLGLPKDQEKVYLDSSAIESAGKLSGALRIAHGTSDDNVHVQNTIQMTQALIKAGKSFELMLYPNKTHGITGADAMSHLYHSIEDHFAKHLAAPANRQ